MSYVVEYGDEDGSTLKAYYTLIEDALAKVREILEKGNTVSGVWVES